MVFWLRRSVNCRPMPLIVHWNRPVFRALRSAALRVYDKYTRAPQESKQKSKIFISGYGIRGYESKSFKNLILLGLVLGYTKPEHPKCLWAIDLWVYVR